MKTLVFIGILFIDNVAESYVRTATVAFYDILTGRLQINSAQGFGQTNSYQSTVNPDSRQSAIQDQGIPAQPLDQMNAEPTVSQAEETQEEHSSEDKNIDDKKDGFK